MNARESLHKGCGGRATEMEEAAVLAGREEEKREGTLFRSLARRRMYRQTWKQLTLS